MAAAMDKTDEITILLVEDEQASRYILGEMLAMKMPAARLVTADNGESGLELYQKHRPDLVITDITMPIMNGLRMAGAIRKLNPDALIILLTAHNDTGYLLDAIEMGIARYVLKPIDQGKLFAAIDRCVERIALERQVSRQLAFVSKLTRAVERSQSMVLFAADDGTIDYVNPRFAAVTGYSCEEMIGRNFRLYLAETTLPDCAEEIWAVVVSGREWRGELKFSTKEGESYWADMTISSIVNGDGVIGSFVVEKEDVTLRKKCERELAERTAALEAVNRERDSSLSLKAHPGLGKT